MLVPYLDAKAVDATFSFMRNRSAVGSFLVFSAPVMPEPIVRMAREDPAGLRALLANPVRLLQFEKRQPLGYGQLETMIHTFRVGEPFKFFFEEHDIGQWLADRGYEMLEHKGPDDMERLYLTRANGTRAGRVLGSAHFLLAKTAARTSPQVGRGSNVEYSTSSRGYPTAPRQHGAATAGEQGSRVV